jgi:hypothetical protein
MYAGEKLTWDFHSGQQSRRNCIIPEVGNSLPLVYCIHEKRVNACVNRAWRSGRLCTILNMMPWYTYAAKTGTKAAILVEAVSRMYVYIALRLLLDTHARKIEHSKQVETAHTLHCIWCLDTRMRQKQAILVEAVSRMYVYIALRLLLDTHARRIEHSKQVETAHTLHCIYTYGHQSSNFGPSGLAYVCIYSAQTTTWHSCSKNRTFQTSGNSTHTTLHMMPWYTYAAKTGTKAAILVEAVSRMYVYIALRLLD